ncbi:MAG: hypothetical protein IJ416_02605 [Ruminiclostridium sp.]|nr:hypothetical protein [Ruminiclostridium sp.]
MSKLLKKLVALGLVASLAATSTVTAFAEDGTIDVTGGTVTAEDGDANTDPDAGTGTEDGKTDETPAEDPKEEADEAVVWVNGKDIKANDKKKIEAKLNKTYYIDITDLLAADAGKTEGETTTADTEAPTPSESNSVSETEAPANEVADGSESASESEAPAADPDAPTSSSSSSTTEPAEEEEKEPTLGLKSEGGKYLVNVLPAPGKDEEANTYADAFDTEKDKVIKNADGAKMAKASFDKKSGGIKVVAGKTAGSIEVWVAELDADKEIVAYNFTTVEVKMAPAKFTVEIPAVEEVKGEDGKVTQEAKEAIAKKATVNVGTAVDLALNITTENVSEDATYTWTLKAAKGAEEKTNYTLEGKGTKATFTPVAMTTATKADKYTITCTNDQSGKKATFAVTVTNDISAMTFGDIALESAAAAASELKLLWNTDVYKTTTAAAFKNSKGEVVYATTDKIKAYVTSTIDTEEAKAWTITSNKGKDKFTLTGEKSSALAVKIAKDGTITLKAKKGTEDGTKVQVTFAVTHADKTIDVYTAVVTIGEKKAAEDEKKCTCDPAPAEGEAHKEGCPLYEAPTCTCDPAPAEGEAHKEGCPLYEAPKCTCDPAPEEGAAHAEGCPLYVAPATE